MAGGKSGRRGSPRLGKPKSLETKSDIASEDLDIAAPWLKAWMEEAHRVQGELEDSRDKYLTLFDFSPAAYIRLDVNGVLLDLNLTASQLIGTPRSFATGTPFLIYVDPPERRHFLGYLRHCRDTEDNVDLELTVNARDGRRMTVEISTRKMVEDSEQTVFHSVLFDRTERKKTKQALVASQKRLSAAVDASGAGVFEHEVPAENGYYCSKRWAAVFGYRKEELPPPRKAADWICSVLHPDDREILFRAYSDFIEGLAPSHRSEVRFKHKEGHWIWIRSWANAVERDMTGRAKHVVGAILDVTEDTNREQELGQKTKQLRRLATQLSLVATRERQEIASELHDNLGQLLGLIEMKLDVLRQSSDDATLRGSLQEIADHTGEASESVRLLISQTSPSILKDLGLVPALQRLARDMEREHGLQISAEANGDLPIVDLDLSAAIYRAVKELLVNVVKHSQIQKARILVDSQPERSRWSITVEDDGVGFDSDKVLSRCIDELHFGIFHIMEHFSSMGGSLEIDSAPGQGTRACLRIPFPLQASKNQ